MKRMKVKWFKSFTPFLAHEQFSIYVKYRKRLIWISCFLVFLSPSLYHSFRPVPKYWTPLKFIRRWNTHTLAHVHSSSIWMRSAWSGTVNSNNPIFLICACVSSFFRQINVKRFRMHFTQKRDANLRGIRLKISIQARITSNSIDWERISESRRNEAEKNSRTTTTPFKTGGGCLNRQTPTKQNDEKWKMKTKCAPRYSFAFTWRCIEKFISR